MMNVNNVTTDTPEVPQLIPSVDLSSPHLEEPTRDEKIEAIRAGAERYRAIMSQAIDDATESIIRDLERLKGEIEDMKSQVISRGASAKAGITEHFNLGTEATRFADAIRQKLNGIMDDAAAVSKV